MSVEDADAAASRIAAAIGEPARGRMLYCLLDGHARTSTELAVVGEVAPSTASAHLSRLLAETLVSVVVRGKHRYYSLDDPNVARALEALSVLAGGPRATFVPGSAQPPRMGTPHGLRSARTCYDHIAGTLGVALHDRFMALRWLEESHDRGYSITPAGASGFKGLGIDVDEARALRRRLAYPCLDWSERRPHLAGALASDVLRVALKRKWVARELDSRALEITKLGSRELRSRLDLRLEG